MNEPYRILLNAGRPAKKLWAKHWWWNLVSRRNGQTIATSELYTSRAARDDTVSAFVLHADSIIHDVFDIPSSAVVTVPRGPQPK
jgi:hypothetical protein